MKVLVTGGTGFIGSHTCVELLEANHEVVIIDNLYNSSIEVLDRIEQLTGKKVSFYQGDVQDEAFLTKVFQEHKIDAAIHFAGYKAVGESVEKPIMYYKNNLDTMLVLCDVMQRFQCKTFVFSSSATVYGSPKSVPIQEDFPLSTTNPYGSTKLFGEQILKDIHIADPSWNIAILRYFNPIGAHKSGLLGESPNDIPNNLMPYICKVATKELETLNVFGNDYPTHDGTGVRDYIHVVDLAKGHLAALNTIHNSQKIDFFNLGTGHGYSVLDLVHTFQEVNQVEVPYQIVGRRAGDIAECYADTKKAEEELHWKAEREIKEMCEDSYRFIKINS